MYGGIFEVFSNLRYLFDKKEFKYETKKMNAIFLKDCDFKLHYHLKKANVVANVLWILSERHNFGINIYID